jgi:hypothetical protein
VLVLCSLVLAGCVNQSVALPAGGRLRPTSPDGVELLDAPPAHDHEVIGTVHAHCRTNWLAAPFNCQDAAMRDALRVRAAEMGADAVVSIRRTRFWQIEWTDLHLRGKAIRWRGDARSGQAASRLTATSSTSPSRNHMPKRRLYQKAVATQ